MNVGGKANYYLEVNTKDEVGRCVLWAEEKKLPVVVIGDGSNLLISDDGFDGLVLRLGNDTIKITKRKNGVYIIKVGAGHKWDKLVEEVVELGLQGIECLSGIPGTVGAAPIQNIGAYGQELKDVFVELKVFDTDTFEFITFNKKDCKFGYRDSVFKEELNKGRYIIFSITVKLRKGKSINVKYPSLVEYFYKNKVNKPSLEQIRKAVLDIRGQKLEDLEKVPNAGSFFRNPVVSRRKFLKLRGKYLTIPGFEYKNRMKLSAGWLIENAGWKGRMLGNVGVSKKHALIIINPDGKGTSDEIMRLVGKISKDVKGKFGVVLVPEVQYVY